MARRKTAKLIILAVFLLMIVRLIQLLLMKIIPPQGINYLLNIFSLQIYYNSGIAFGLPFSNILLIIINLIISIYFLNLFWQALVKNKSHYPIPIIFILIGAVSNLLERIKYGYVIDFFQIWIFPIFNLADLLIIIGVVWLIIIWLNK